MRNFGFGVFISSLTLSLAPSLAQSYAGESADYVKQGFVDALPAEIRLT